LNLNIGIDEKQKLHIHYFFGFISINLLAQQIADTTFNPVIPRPEYARGI
jgi:hypothetical protein